MKKQIKRLAKFISVLSLLAFVPMVTFAQTPVTDLGSAISKINDILNSILPLLIALGVIYFVWGIVQYFIGNSEEAKKNGRERIIYAIIGLTVIVGVWGLVNIVVTTFNLKQNANVPTLITTTTAAGAGASCPTPTNVQTFLGFITCIINNSIIPLIFAIAIVMFIWGAVKFFIIEADEEAKRQQGKQFMIWGVVALAVMISVWGLISILGTTFGLKVNALPQVCPPGSTNCP